MAVPWRSNVSACVRTKEFNWRLSLKGSNFSNPQINSWNYIFEFNSSLLAFHACQLCSKFPSPFHTVTINDSWCFFQGGVGLRIRVFDRRICFVNNHFAAHQENVSRRNADFDHIYRTMTFNKPHGSTGMLLSNASWKYYCLLTLLYMTPITHFLCCCTTASATSVQLHKAVSVCDHQTVFTTIIG